jgi:hypothetical protein
MVSHRAPRLKISRVKIYANTGVEIMVMISTGSSLNIHAR